MYCLDQSKGGASLVINSYSSKPYGCPFDGRPGMGTGEHNFGWYANGKVNLDH